MVVSIRPRRSLLYMPGSNARAIAKGRSLGADGLILDLEDSVLPDAKNMARAQVVDALREGGYGHRELIVRVNSLNTVWGEEDIVAISTSGANAILLPKVDNAAEIQQAVKIMIASNAPDDLAIWAMMESPLGILHSEEIAFSSSRMKCLVLGTSDLARDLHCSHTIDRLPMLSSIELCILSARAAGIAVIDGVFLDLNDDEGFKYSCTQGLELGFDGKTLIHPKTIEIANSVYAPSRTELEWSHAVIKAHKRAAEKGQGVTILEGKLIENLHVRNAKRLLELNKIISKRKS